MADPKPVLALVAENENGALRLASEGYAGPFSFRGYAQKVINLLEPSGPQALQDSLKTGEVAFAYGLAGVGSALPLADGRNIWEAYRTPFFSLWYDHPSYNYRQHIVDSSYVLNVYHIRDHFEARQAHLPPARSGSVLIRPPCSPESRKNIEPFRKRQRRILYAKTALRPDEWSSDWKRHPQALQDVLWGLVDLALKDRNLDLSGAGARLFRERGLDTQNLDLFMGAVQEVDAYIRAWRSDRLARALLPHPATIIGRGWDYLEGASSQVSISGPVPAETFWRQIREHQIIANSSPLWRDGIHERAVSGINLGAVALTDRTEKSDAVFGGLSTYAAFDWQDDLQDVVAEALKRADATEEASYAAIDEALEKNFYARPDAYIIELLHLLATRFPARET